MFGFRGFRLAAELGRGAAPLALWLLLAWNAPGCDGGPSHVTDSCDRTRIEVRPQATGNCRTGSCSLLEAFRYANGCPELAVTLALREGTYTVAGPLDESSPDALPTVTGRVRLLGQDARLEPETTPPERSFRFLTVAPDAHLEIHALALAGGRAALGGAIHNEGHLLLSDVHFENNHADEAGGAIYNRGTLEMRGGGFASNRAGGEQAGAAPARGGALFVEAAGRARLEGVQVTGNRADLGGGVFASGTLEIRDSTFRRNRAQEGGGVHVDGLLVARGTTWAENESRVRGAGVLVGAAATAVLSDVTISDNTSFDVGGGLFVAGIANLRSSTVYANWARPGSQGGGGIASADESLLRIEASVVAGTRSGGDCSLLGEVSLRDANLASDESCPGFEVAEDPFAIFRDLADNGGPTPTHLPWEDSPALDARLASCEGLDQRGFPRGEDGDLDGYGGCDLGAVELRPSEIR